MFSIYNLNMQAEWAKAFPSSKISYFQNKAWSKTKRRNENDIYLHGGKNHFHINKLALKQRLGTSRNQPI